MTAAEAAPRLMLLATLSIALGAFILVWPLVSTSIWSVVFVSARNIGWSMLAFGAAFGIAGYVAQARSNAESQRFRQTGFTRNDLRTLSPAQFEEWCAVRLREQGYRVSVVGGQGDHGVDLIAERDTERVVVQCKRWFGIRQIGEPQIRDLFGAMQHERATRGMVLTTGQFTAAASSWAAGKPIKLWSVEQLLAGSPPAGIKPTTVTAATPSCPSCGRSLVQRVNRTTKDAFWGCAGYPACRYTRAI